MQRLFVFLVGSGLVAVVLRPAAAEQLFLSSGGHLEGKLLNRDEDPRSTYQFKMTNGVEVSIAAEQVTGFKADRPEVIEYEQIRDKYPNTVDGQFKLAIWCRDHGLVAQKKQHLQRVIQLDPDHTEARRMLDYNKIDGQWMTVEEKRTKEGFVRDKHGDWKLPQEIELQEQRDRQQAAEKEWFGKVKQWRGWLDGNRRKLGRDNLVNITDPSAVTALAKKLIGVENSLAQDPSLEARLIYVEALAHIAVSQSDPSKAVSARSALALAALQDNEDEVRLSCLDELTKQKEDPLTVAFFIKQLHNKQNYMVNRAAVGLSRMKDPTAIGPLIDALITTHKHTVGGNSPGQTTSTFGTKGTPGGGLSMNQKPTVIQEHIQNQAVLDALVTLTQQNFGFSISDWHAWFVAQQSKGARGVDVRRDK